MKKGEQKGKGEEGGGQERGKRETGVQCEALGCIGRKGETPRAGLTGDDKRHRKGIAIEADKGEGRGVRRRGEGEDG